MAMRIILKHSSVEDQHPTPAQAGQAGELLLNTNAAGAFLSCLDSAGDIHQVGGIKISTAAPANPVKGTVWLDVNLGLDRGVLKVYNGSQWVVGGGTFDACANGGLVQDSSTGCWSVELSIDDLTDVDTSTNPPSVNEILIWNGTNWVPESLDNVQLDWSDLPACTGGGFIYDAVNECWQVDWSTLPACTNGGLVYDTTNNCWKVETDWSELPTCTNSGLVYDNSDPDPANHCWEVDWSQFPNCNTSLIWDAVNECWTAVGGGGGGGFVGCGNDFTFDSVNDCWSINWQALPDCDSLAWDNTSECWGVEWTQLPNCDSLAYDNTSECWGVDWSKFPGGDHIDWDPIDKEWDVIPVPPVEINDVTPTVKPEYFWWDSAKGELFVGYEDPSGDEYWVSASKPGADGADGNPVVISQPTPPPFEEDTIWFNTTTGEAFFGYKDPSGDEYWVSLSKPGADGKDGDPVVISEPTAPQFKEDAIWYNTISGEAFFGYKDPSGDEYWVSLIKPGADGKDGESVVISEPTAPQFKEDAIWYNTTSGEAFFGYADPSGDEYWVSLVKPGADGKDGESVVISEPTAPQFKEDAIWYNTTSGEAFFGYTDPSGDEYWVSLVKPGADGADGVVRCYFK